MGHSVELSKIHYCMNLHPNATSSFQVACDFLMQQYEYSLCSLWLRLNAASFTWTIEPHMTYKHVQVKKSLIYSFDKFSKNTK